MTDKMEIHDLRRFIKRHSGEIIQSNELPHAVLQRDRIIIDADLPHHTADDLTFPPNVSCEQRAGNTVRFEMDV